MRCKKERCTIAGHSKWAQIKHKKSATDEKRSGLFGKLTRAITVAARAGGDPQLNHELRLAIEKAKAENMPKENIKRAIAKGAGAGAGDGIEPVTYEIYGPSGVAVLVLALTDNKNRTLGEIKGVLNKYGGKLAAAGSVGYLFMRKGIINVSIEGQGSEEAELKIIESGADDYAKTDAGYMVYTDPSKSVEVAEKLQAEGVKVLSSEPAMEPQETIKLPDAQAEKVLKLLEALDELNDVNEVNSNLG